MNLTGTIVERDIRAKADEFAKGNTERWNGYFAGAMYWHGEVLHLRERLKLEEKKPIKETTPAPPSALDYI